MTWDKHLDSKKIRRLSDVSYDIAVIHNTLTRLYSVIIRKIFSMILSEYWIGRLNNINLYIKVKSPVPLPGTDSRQVGFSTSNAPADNSCQEPSAREFHMSIKSISSNNISRIHPNVWGSCQLSRWWQYRSHQTSEPSNMTFRYDLPPVLLRMYH